MTNQEILNNAPPKATHVDSDNHYWHNSSAGYWLCCDDGSTTLNACVGNRVRSLADIRRIVDDAGEIKSLENGLFKAQQRIKELEQELNTVHKHIKLMFPHPQVTDGLFYVPIERYNNLVDELNKQAEDL